MWEKVKYWVGDNKADLLAALIIVLVSIASFGLGRLSAIWPAKKPIQITQEWDGGLSGATTSQGVRSPSGGQNRPQETPLGQGGVIGSIPDGMQYVGSKSGSAYHYPWCSGAQRIKEENKIWFATKEEAAAKGYKPAGNCPGL